MPQERNRIENEQFALIRLDSEKDFKSDFILDFNSGDTDLNDFFHNDAFPHHKELLAATYCLQAQEAIRQGFVEPLAFVSFLNDSIKILRAERKEKKRSLWNLLRKEVPNPKRFYESFPAVKIGRLAVEKQYQRQDIGTSLLNLTKEFFLTNNRTGCRFLTVDAYNCEPVINFYLKNKFDYLHDEDRESDTRIMWFDLMSYSRS